jgi:uncharacterized coiled-coil protein SlyX
MTEPAQLKDAQETVEPQSNLERIALAFAASNDRLLELSEKLLASNDRLLAELKEGLAARERLIEMNQELLALLEERLPTGVKH